MRRLWSTSTGRSRRPTASASSPSGPRPSTPLAIIKDDKDLRAQADTLYEQLGLPKPLPPPTLRE